MEGFLFARLKAFVEEDEEEVKPESTEQCGSVKEEVKPESTEQGGSVKEEVKLESTQGVASSSSHYVTDAVCFLFWLW